MTVSFDAPGRFAYHLAGPGFSEYTIAPTWADLVAMLPYDLGLCQGQYAECQQAAHDSCGWGDCFTAAQRRVGELAALPEGSAFQVRFGRTWLTCPPPPPG